MNKTINNPKITNEERGHSMSTEFIELLQEIFAERSELIYQTDANPTFSARELVLIEATLIAADFAKTENIQI